MHMTSVVETVRSQWRVFLPAWLFPVIMFPVAVFGANLPNAWLPIISVAGVAFFLWTFLRWVKPAANRKFSALHAIVLGLLAPFLIWLTCAAVAMATWNTYAFLIQ